MMSSLTRPQTPVYPLLQTSLHGNGDFEIAQIQGLAPHQKELFFVPHRKDFYLLAFVWSGSSRHWVDGVPFSVKPNTLYFSSPHQLFLKEEGFFQATAISFTPAFLDLEATSLLRQLSIIQNPHNAHELALSAADIAFIEDLAAKLLNEQEQHQRLRTSMLGAYLQVLLIYLSRLYNAQYTGNAEAADQTLLLRFRNLVNDHYTHSHDVAAYAYRLHLSASHFSELIKKQSGKTPMEHIHDRLLLEAKRQLFHTEASVKEISFDLGFEEASYFSRFFKRLTGHTPLSYRGAIREMYR